MDTEQNFQFSSHPNGKPLQPPPHVHQAEPDEGSGQTVDLAWVLDVARRRASIIAGVALTVIISSGSWLAWSKYQTVPEYQGSFKLLVEPVTAEDRLRNQFLLSQSQALDLQRIEVDRSSLLDYETQIRVLESPKLLNPVLNYLQRRYPEIDYKSLTVNLLINRITYEKDGKEEGTKIIEVRYMNEDQKQVEFVLKKLADVYLQYSLQERQQSLYQGIEFIEDQLPTLQQQVDQIQGQLQKLRQKYNLLDPIVADNLLTEHILAIRRNRLETEEQLAKTRETYNTLKRQLIEEDATAVLSTESQTYQALLGEMQRLEAQIASESAQFRDDSPPLEILREKQQNMRRILSQEAEAILGNLEGQIKGLEEQYKAILNTENEINQQLEQLPDVARQIGDLQRKLDVSTDNLKDFLSKRETLKLDAAQQEIPWQLIEPPQLWRDEMGRLIPVERQSIKRPFAIAVVLGVLLGIGVGFLTEILHKVFHTPDEIKETTNLPILGVIPWAKEFKKLAKQPSQLATIAQVAHSVPPKKRHLLFSRNNRGTEYSNSPFTESFRSLYTNIRLLSSKQSIQSLAISSPVSGDGKTMVALYLAQTAATIGKRVLLVDTDLRSPQLHSRFDLPNTQGLSDMIASDLTLEDAIQKSSLDQNLFVLTAGQTLSDPVKLLSSDKMQCFMEQVSSQFDLVIYDTPPLLGLGDGNLLAAKADGTILVVGVEKTDRSLVTKAFDGLKIARASILGIVANGVKIEKTKSYIAYRR